MYIAEAIAKAIDENNVRLEQDLRNAGVDIEMSD